MTVLPAKVEEKLFFGRSGNRAGSRAVAAGDAGICVDNVLVVALGDGADRALFGASAALDAIVGNLKSHGSSSFGICIRAWCSLNYILSYIFKNARGFGNIFCRSACRRCRLPAGVGGRKRKESLGRRAESHGLV